MDHSPAKRKPDQLAETGLCLFKTICANPRDFPGLDRSFPKFLLDILSTNKSQLNLGTKRAYYAVKLPIGVHFMVLKRTCGRAEDREGLLPKGGAIIA